MNACLIAIGSELLRFGRKDSNGDWLATRLEAYGVQVRQRVVVEDEIAAIAAAVESGMHGADLLIVTGGLGPTEDDLTRVALARALRVPLERDPEQVVSLRAWFEDKGRPFQPVQAVQADRPQGAEWIFNPLGSAPGILMRHSRGLLVAVPGVPAEMRAMFDAAVVPVLQAQPERTIARASLAIGGRPEADVEQRIGDLTAGSDVEVTILSGVEGVELHLQAAGPPGSAPETRVAALREALKRRLGADVYGSAGVALANVVGQALLARKATLATAESCTAGLVAATLTDQPGASAWYRGGVVAYDNELKSDLLGVGPDLIAEHGAVSPQVARALALGARERCGSTFGIGITGICGPTGGTPDKPVGRVYLAVAGKAAGPGTDSDMVSGVHDHTRLMLGDRNLIRRRTVTWVLDTLRRRLL